MRSVYLEGCITHQHNVLDLGKIGARHLYCVDVGLRRSLLRGARRFGGVSLMVRFDTLTTESQRAGSGK